MSTYKYHREIIPKSTMTKRGVAKRMQVDARNAEAARLRHETLLGLAIEIEEGTARIRLSDPRWSLAYRRAAAIREAVELLGGPKL